MHHIKNEDSHVWMLAGTGYIDLSKVYEKLGPCLSRSLPGFHAITGCDNNPAFKKKGKLRPFNILNKNQDYQEAFTRFGEQVLLSNPKQET